MVCVIPDSMAGCYGEIVVRFVKGLGEEQGARKERLTAQVGRLARL